MMLLLLHCTNHQHSTSCYVAHWMSFQCLSRVASSANSSGMVGVLEAAAAPDDRGDRERARTLLDPEPLLNPAALSAAALSDCVRISGDSSALDSLSRLAITPI
eukprot:12402028-Karenia_brevis.AAC.1